ncbi:MAG TPA: VTT domain-containing protein [Vicinamibacterales bacterium]|nr:VTT domain-containing protein [Vicinamibacterales bacterium]
MTGQLFIALVLGTFVSEDLTSISAGLLVRAGDSALVPALTACALGVYVGDLGLWLAGRVLGRRLLTWPWIARRVDQRALTALSMRIDDNLAVAVLASRFLPGSRLPMYLAAGIWGRRPIAFAGWSMIAVLLWTPLLVVLTAVYGTTLTTPLLGELGGVSQFTMTAALLFAGLKLVTRAVRTAS